MKSFILILSCLLMLTVQSGFATSKETSIYMIKNDSSHNLGIRYLDEDNFIDSWGWQIYSIKLNKSKLSLNDLFQT